MVEVPDGMVTKVKWGAFPCASMNEMLKRLQQIEDNPNTEVFTIVQVSPGHNAVYYKEHQVLNDPSKDARIVDKEKNRLAARAAAREAREKAEKAQAGKVQTTPSREVES